MKAYAMLITNIVLVGFILTAILLILGKVKKKRIWLMLLMIYILLTPKVNNFVLNAWLVDDTVKPDLFYDAVIVLAGITNRSWHVSGESRTFPYYVQFGREGNRIVKGVQLVKSQKARLLMIGDLRIRGYLEGEFLKSFAIQNGTPENICVVYGKEVHGTLDEARQAAVYLHKHSMKNVILVTSAIHMRRAAASFRKFGVSADLFSVNRSSVISISNPFIPKSDIIKNYEGLLLEVVAYIGAVLMSNR